MQRNKEKDASTNFSISSAAGFVKGAAKTGKQLSGSLLGSGLGPYGLLAGTILGNRKLIGMFLGTFAILFFLPVLYILMLPALIFSNDGIASASESVLENPTVITQNIAETEAAISAILTDAHDEILKDVQNEIDSLGDDCEYSVSDPFADHLNYESVLVISQFCASENNFEEIKLSKLKRVLKKNVKNLFGYTVSTSSYETTEEITQKKVTITYYHYSIEYAGSDYFADTVFSLTDHQKITAAEYASNLRLFLNDITAQ